MAVLVFSAKDKVILLFKLFTEFTAEGWSAAVSYYMWLTVNVNATSKLKSRSRFLYCCALVYGAPFVVVVLAEAADRIPAVPDILKHKIEETEECYFTTFLTNWMYSIAPSTCIKLVQLALILATLARIAAGERNARMLEGTESRRHNAEKINWIALYTKISLIMGLNSIILNFIALMTWIVEVPPVLHKTVNELECYRGIEVFLVSVCQWGVLRSAVKRLVFWKRNNSPV